VTAPATAATRAARAQADVAPARPLPPRLRDPRAERDADAFAAGRRRPADRVRPAAAGRGAAPRGDALPPAVRAWAEPRLGVDLGGVRVKHDAEAHAVAADRQARALTSKREILFAQGEYRPDTPAGRELLLHELAHAAEQEDGRGPRSQHQEQPQTTATGIGRTPPDADYAVATMAATSDEDLSLLFDRDHADVDRTLPDRVRAVLASHTGAVVVRIHGYASAEGDERYNLNLSAWRAVRVRDAVAALLPAGSAVHLIAHGETNAFGDDVRDNRRVGIGVSDMPAQPTAEEQAQRWLDRHPRPLGSGLELHVDPSIAQSLTAAPPVIVVPPPSPTVPLPGRGLLDWTPGDPNSLVDRNRPGPFLPSFSPLAPGVVEPYIPWAIFAQDFRLRQVPFGDGDRTVILQHWQRWYPLAHAVYNLGGPVGLFFDSPNDLMTTLTRKMISSSLSGDHPDAIEAMDQQLQRAGLPTPIYVPLPYGTWQFDADFRNWSRPHIK